MPTPDFDAEKAALRDRQRHHLAAQAAAEAADHDRTVRAYWTERAAETPDDPDVLRARAALLESGGGIAVTAKPARVAAKGGKG